MPGDPVVGSTTLRRPAIASPNYQAGAAGWSINADGSAEFNNATIRGTVTAATVIGALIESAASGRRTTLDQFGDLKIYNAFSAILFWISNGQDAIWIYADTGSAAQGALTSSIATAAGTDPFGNAYLAGQAAYSGGGGFFLATSVSAGKLNTYSAASAAGPWTQLAQVGALASDGNVHFAAVGGAFLVADTILYKQSNAGSGRETWQDMRPLLNSFVGTIVNRYPPQYRFAPDGNVEIAGFIQLPASYTSVTFATLPAAYQPGNNTGHKWPVVLETNVTPVGTPCVQIDTSGNLQLHNMPAGLSGTIVSIYGRYPLSATQLLIS